MPEIEKLSTADFAAKIKAKYPEYKDVDDNVLTEKMIAKYPEYKDKVNYNTSVTVEKKNPVQSARPLPNAGENSTVSSTETALPSTVSASESVQRPAPTPLASTRMPNAPTSDPNLIARQQEQQIAEQQRNAQQSAFNEVPTNIPVVPTRQQPTVDLQPMPTETIVTGGQSYEFQRNIADLTPKKDQNYLSLGQEEKPLADNLLKGVYADVISKRPDKSNISEEEITEYIFANTPDTGNPEVDIKVRNAALEQVLGDKNIGDNRFDEMRSKYKKEERSNVLNTYVKKEYGDFADTLVEELGIKRGISYSQENINNSTVTLSDDALKALYNNGQYRFTISQSESDIAPNLVKRTQDGSSGLVVDYASSKIGNIQQGQQVADLTFEQVKELYKKGALTFPNPLSDPMFSAYVNEAAPKVERVKTTQLKNKSIESFTGKPLNEATPQENVAGFLKVVKDVDANIQKLDIFDTDTKIIKKSYDRLIDVNNKIKEIDSQISALQGGEMTDEKRQQLSALNTQREIYQENVDRMSNDIEQRKEQVLGYSTKLFDPLTGEPLDPALANNNPSVVKWNEDLNAKTDKYLKGYQGSLEEAKVDSYNKFKYYQGLILSQDRFKAYHDEVKGGGVPYPFFESSDNLLNAYQDAASELTAVSRVEALNLDIQDMPRYKGAAFVNGLLDASIGGKSYKTSTEFTQDFVNAAQENGIELTDAQKNRAKETFGEKAAYATGASLPVMIQIVATTLATEGLGLGAAIGEAATLVKGMKAVKDSKSLVKAVDILEDAVKTGFVFDVSGESFATGVGESLGEQLGAGLTNAIDLSKIFGSTKAGKVFGTILNATAKRASGATGEVIAEYVGEFVDELSKNDLTTAIANTIGDDPLEKLALTYMVSGIYSSASSIGDIGKFRENIKEAIKSDPRPDSELPPIVQEVKKAILEQEKSEAEIEKKVSETVTPEPISKTETTETSEPMAGETQTETEPTKPTINPIIENIEGQGRAYKDSEGRFFSEKEVVYMIEKGDDAVNGILLTNPSENVLNALEKAKEQTEPVKELETEPSQTTETLETEPVKEQGEDTKEQSLSSVEETAKALELENLTDDELSQFHEKLSTSKDFDVKVLSNLIENIEEKRERQSILNSPLDKVSETVDGILKKDSYFLEKKEAREVKAVAEKYQGEVSKKEAQKDFKDAFFGNPDNWVADSLKMREAVRVFMENGGTFKELLSTVQKEFESDGFTEQEAARSIKSVLDSLTKKDFRQEQISEAYHKAKADGSNPELVKAVEELLGKPTEPTQAGEKQVETPKKDEIQQTETKAEAIQEVAGKTELEKESELPTKVTEKAKKQGLMTSTGQTNSYMLKKLQKVQPTTARQAILRAFVGGTKILSSDMTRETGFGAASGLDGKIRGKEEAENKKYITTADTKTGKTVDDLVLMVAETLEANGIPVNESEIRNEIITVLSDFNTRQEMASELFEDFSLDGVLFETMEEKLEASAIAYYSDSSNFEPEFTKEEIAAFEQEEEFNQYINNLSDAEIEQIYGRYEPTGEATKPTQGGESKTVAPKTEVTKEPAQVKKLADKLRSLKIDTKGKAFDATLGIPISVWNTTMDIIASGLEAGLSISEAIKKGIDNLKSDNVTFDEKAFTDKMNEVLSEEEAVVEEKPQPKKEEPKKPASEGGETKQSSPVKTVAKRFIDSGIDPELAERVAELSQKKPKTDKARLEIIDQTIESLGLETAYQLSTNPTTESAFSQETKNYLAIAYADSLRQQLDAETDTNKRNVLINKIADVMNKVSSFAEDTGGVIQFFSPIYDRFPEMKTEKTVLDSLNSQVKEAMDAPSDIDGQTVSETIEEVRESIKEELGKEFDSIIETLQEKIKERDEKIAELKENAENIRERKKNAKTNLTKHVSDLKKALSFGSGSASGTLVILNNDAVKAIANIVKDLMDLGVLATKDIINRVQLELSSAGISGVKDSDIENIANDVKAKKNKITNKEIREIFNEYFLNSNAATDSFIDYLADKLGYTPREMRSIFPDLESVIESKVKEVATKELSKNLAPALTPEQKLARAEKMREARKISNKVSKSIMLGNLSGTDFKNAFAEKYNIPVITEAQMQNLTDLVRLSKEFEKAGQRELFIKAQRRINTDLKMMKPKDASFFAKVIMEAAYLNALSGINTQGNANVGAMLTSGLNILAKMLTTSPAKTLYGFRSMIKSFSAASKSATEARKRNYSRFTDYNSYYEGSTAMEMGVIEQQVLKGTLDYFRRISKDKSLSENTLNLVKAIGQSLLQYSRMNFLLNAADAFLTTQYSEFNAALNAYNEVQSDLGVKEKIPFLVTGKDLMKTLDEKMGYDKKQDYQKQAGREIEAEKARITKEVDALGLSPQAAEIEVRKRIKEGISTGYKTRRTQELMETSRGKAIQDAAVKSAKDWIMLNDPDGFLGIVNEFVKKTLTPKEGESGVKTIARTIGGLTIMFSRMTFNTMNAIIASTPIVGAIPTIIGTSKNAEGEWKFGYKGKYNKDLMWRRLASNAIMTAVGTAVFAEMFEWDDEDEEWKLDPNRLIDITFGAYSGDKEKFKQGMEGYSGSGVSFAFRTDPSKDFDNYKSFKLLPQSLPIMAIIGNYADKTKGIGSKKSLDKFSEDKSIVNTKSLGLAMSQLLEGSFNSIGKMTKSIQMQDPESFPEAVGMLGVELTLQPLKGVLQPNFYRDALNEMGARGKYKKAYPKNWYQKLAFDFWAIDNMYDSEIMTDRFGNPVESKSKVSMWVNGDHNNANHDNKEWEVVFKYPSVTISPYQVTDVITTSYKSNAGTTYKYAYKIVDEDVKREVSEAEKKYLKEFVLKDYDNLMKLDEEKLQKVLDKKRDKAIEKAKMDIVKKYKDDETKIIKK